ncbi:MAG: hypothetical protein SFX74_07250 [Fimbriimonadaceae bacterium]|nr:hypothetical protein [Fimbriimonadaceae bacterium]
MMISPGEYPIREGDGGHWIDFGQDKKSGQPWFVQTIAPGFFEILADASAELRGRATVSGPDGGFRLEPVWLAGRILVAMDVVDMARDERLRLEPIESWYGGAYTHGGQRYEVRTGDVSTQIRLGDGCVAEIRAAWKDSDTKRGIHHFVRVHREVPPLGMAAMFFGWLNQIVFNSTCGHESALMQCRHRPMY